MLVSKALEYIRKQLEIYAKKEIINKFSARDDAIKNNFEYYENDKLKFRHDFAIITDEIILKNLYMEMLSLCVSQIPLSLLIEKGAGDDIIRNLNDDFDIRKPKELNINENADIDEPLFISAIYNTLALLGINDFRTKAKDILSEYARTLVIPDLKNISDLNFGFSADKTSWHSSYQAGDNYFRIYKRGAWGEAIPLISGNGGGGAKRFTELIDCPKTHQSGKILKSNGTSLEWADLPAANTQTPNQAPIDETFKEVEANENGIDFTNLTNIKIKLNKNTIFSVAQDSSYNYLMPLNKEYKVIVDTNFQFKLQFNKQLKILKNKNNIPEVFDALQSYPYVTFNLIRINADEVVVYNINY